MADSDLRTLPETSGEVSSGVAPEVTQDGVVVLTGTVVGTGDGLQAATGRDQYAAAAVGVLAALEPALAPAVDPAAVLADLVERWAGTYSPRTAAVRRFHLEDWLAYCAERGVDPLTVRQDVVLAYQREMEATDYAPMTVRARLGAVRSFYAFLVEERARYDDPALGTARRPPVTIAAALAVAGQDRTVEQLAAGFLLTYTRNTRTAYSQALRFFFTYCQEIGVDPLGAQRPHLDGFRALLDSRYAPRTSNQRLTVVRAWYRYCVEEEALHTSPARSLKLHRLPNVTTSTGLDREEVRALLAAARRDGPQMHALLTLLALNGLRISEALEADVEGLATIRGHRVLTVQRKGFWGTPQAVPLAARTSGLLDVWLEERPAVVAPDVGDGQHGPIFLTPSTGRRLTRANVWSRMRTLARTAVPDKAATIHPHDLRNAFITLSLDAGVPLRDVQDSAGHASADTTRRYDTGRNNLDRNATYVLAGYIGGSDDEQGRGDA